MLSGSAGVDMQRAEQFFRARCDAIEIDVAQSTEQVECPLLDVRFEE